MISFAHFLAVFVFSNNVDVRSVPFESMWHLWFSQHRCCGWSRLHRSWRNGWSAMTDFLLKRRCAPSGTGQQMRVEAARAMMERVTPVACMVSFNLLVHVWSSFILFIFFKYNYMFNEFSVQYYRTELSFDMLTCSPCGCGFLRVLWFSPTDQKTCRLGQLATLN